MNNYKRNKKKKRKIHTNRLVLIFMMTLIFIVGIGVFLNSSFFTMKNIVLEGNTHIKEDNLVEELNIVQNRNIFTYDTKKIKEQVLKSPYIQGVKIKFKLPGTMLISIDEITPVALLKNGNNLCYISKEGKKIENIQDLKENTDKIIIDIEYENKNNEIEFKNDEDKKRLLYLLDSIYSNSINKEIYEISLQKDEKISLITKSNIEVIVPNDNNLDYNISRLSKVLVDLKSKNKKDGTVDLTYSNYALYSPK